MSASWVTGAIILFLALAKANLAKVWWLGFAICPNRARSNYSLNWVSCIAIRNFCCDLRSVSTLPSCIIYLLLLFTYHPNIQSQLFTLLLRHYFKISAWVFIHTSYAALASQQAEKEWSACLAMNLVRIIRLILYSSNPTTKWGQYISTSYLQPMPMVCQWLLLPDRQSCPLSKQWILINQGFLRSIRQVRIETTVFGNCSLNWPMFFNLLCSFSVFFLLSSCPVCRYSFN